MKFITNKGAPDIPLKVIEAQESKNLIFFCGSGVSYAAELPVFSGLVENVFKNIGVVKTEAETEAINNGFYDRALGLLEARIIGETKPEVNLVRKAIVDELTLKENANLDNHKAILDLSIFSNSRARLVTTNVDHGFLKADSANLCNIDYAPKLPVPKPHKWSSIVHLHGIISNEDDPNGQNLVFTSGDFGTAYLTERWASKFVTELFSNFTILFVGYSVNDPVMRYITDAIAAERLQGYDLFRQPYIISRTTPSKRTINENQWEAKGIVPILYEYSHGNLYKTLKEWAKYIKDGLNAKARIILKEAAIAPIPPYSESPEVQRLVDVLREKENPTNETVTGYPARVFSEINNPPAPIEWLPVLHEKGLLEISSNRTEVFPVHESPILANLHSPSIISLNLWNWFLRHLESKDLIKWIIENGTCLHPELCSRIHRHISKYPPKEPYLLFWRLLTSSYLQCNRRSNSQGIDIIRSLNNGMDQLIINEFCKLLTPSISVETSYDYSDFIDDDDYEKPPPYRIKIVLPLSEWVYSELIKMVP